MSTSAKGFAARAAVAGVLGFGAAVAFSAAAAAEPLPGDPAGPVAPVDPAAPVAPVGPPVSPGVASFGPLGALPALSGADFLLGQAPIPEGAQVVAGSNPNVLDASQFLIPQNYRVPAPDQTSPYALAEGDPGPFARVDALKGAHAIVHGALGRMPIDQLSQPLPGTAPAPGTQIPVGPEQNLPELVNPAAPLPAYPGAPLPPAPAELPPPPPAG